MIILGKSINSRILAYIEQGVSRELSRFMSINSPEVR